MGMYFKVAFSNVRKSFKDYSIYFMTLTFAVCIFYSFNSIGSQKAFLEMENMAAQIVDSLVTVIGYISIFVSFVLGGLIIYGNRFLIKKRKKEFGTYMILGMGKWKLSKILFFETLIVGLLALLSGLALGVLVSQGVSIFTISLFDIPMGDYTFLLSLEAIKKSLLYFGLMFGVAMIFNVISVSKYKVIQLLRADQVHEDIRMKSSGIYTLFFIASLGIIGWAYTLVLETGFRPQEIKFISSIALSRSL